jgi:hypothetical protein
MAIAGYNPDQTAFWTRMASSNGQAPPEFLVHIHLMHQNSNLQAMVPEAKAIAAKFGMIYK